MSAHFTLLSGVNKAWVAAGMLALLTSGMLQQRVERRRIDAKLTYTDQKQTLEVGFLALGGFRGVLADVLWVRAIRHQDSGRYYQLKLICELIQKLQPTDTQVHSFQAHNMLYNLAARAESREDRWFWIKSGLQAMEKALERNKHKHALWWELGWYYYDRLGDEKIGDCKELRQQELPRYDDLTDEQRAVVFSSAGQWKTRPARSDEHIRFAAYYFWRALETGTDRFPLNTESMLGRCMDQLGHWYPSPKPPEARKSWEDWGSEDWWVEIRRRVKERDLPDSRVTGNLQFCMYQQMDFHLQMANRAPAPAAVNHIRKAEDAHRRFQQYFPDDKRSLEQVIKEHRAQQQKLLGREPLKLPAH